MWGGEWKYFHLHVSKSILWRRRDLLLPEYQCQTDSGLGVRLAQSRLPINHPASLHQGGIWAVRQIKTLEGACLGALLHTFTVARITQVTQWRKICVNAESKESHIIVIHHYYQVHSTILHSLLEQWITPWQVQMQDIYCVALKWYDKLNCKTTT